MFPEWSDRRTQNSLVTVTVNLQATADEMDFGCRGLEAYKEAKQVENECNRICADSIKR